MGFKQLLPVILAVLKDIRVIITVVVMIFIIEFSKYITNYKKRPPRPKVKKQKKGAAPKPAEKKESSEEGAAKEAE